MKTIWKFPLRLTNHQLIDMPVHAQILSAQVQDGVMTLWAVVNPDSPKMPHTIAIYGTGNYITDENLGTFIGTLQVDWMVWHIFDQGVKTP